MLIEDLLDGFAALTGIGLIPDRLPYASDDETETTLAVPGYQQTESYGCGFVAGLMVLHTFKPKASIDRFFRRVNPDREWGIETGPLGEALRQSGVGVSVRENLTYDRIAETLEEGYLIITCVKTGQSDVDHWVVAYGYGVSPNRIFVAGNGILRRHVLPWADFRRVWSPKGFGLVCWGK